jgi:MoaA/NifB/PqqE/SkfB family radical SAM enzyme
MLPINNNQTSNYKAIQFLSGGEKEKIDWMLSNMEHNKAFIYKSENLTKIEKIKLLEKFKKLYINYRISWKGQPKECFENNIYGNKFKELKKIPLCVDLELASICDLACPHCFRQFIPTPDKIMDKKLAFKLIDEASLLGVPSMKFNWRGEPLLNPSTSEIINYAKKKGIVETIINTNATVLDIKTAKKIINSGLDTLIYSFDGGTKSSYEKMRPGRFKENKYELIIENIKNFSKLRKEMNSAFPRTKIQMVLTKDTRSEQNEFFELFKDYVDDVSVKQYSERGGKIKDIDDNFKNKLNIKFKKSIKNFDPSTSIMMDYKNNILVSNERIPCEQPFQRLLITYDGRASMCCYDWGVAHPVGVVDELANKVGNTEHNKVLKKSLKKEKSFELMNLKKTEYFNELPKKICSISNIWNGKEINKVRELHVKNKINDVKICEGCTFKDTYKWSKH